MNHPFIHPCKSTSLWMNKNVHFSPDFSLLLNVIKFNGLYACVCVWVAFRGIVSFLCKYTQNATQKNNHTERELFQLLNFCCIRIFFWKIFFIFTWYETLHMKFFFFFHFITFNIISFMLTFTFIFCSLDNGKKNISYTILFFRSKKKTSFLLSWKKKHKK